MLHSNIQNQAVAAFSALIASAIFVIASVGPAANNAANLLV